MGSFSTGTRPPASPAMFGVPGIGPDGPWRVDAARRDACFPPTGSYADPWMSAYAAARVVLCSAHRTPPYRGDANPQGTSFHRLVELEYLLSDLIGCHAGCGPPGPLELGAINPDAVHDHGQPT